jgi:uncharacterized protein with ParB-like and HNH nuclease domain
LIASELQQSRAIDGKGKTVRELLANRKYSIDYYQREYKWEKKQLLELINDLSQKFEENYEATHERDAVNDYGHYFLGSIIISNKDGEKFIIDGQQRLTTLTLLLIFIRRHLPEGAQKNDLSDLIFSFKFGKPSFNLNIAERTACMNALFEGVDYVVAEESESITNILARYADMDDCFPEDLLGDALPFFSDWLIENVHLVEITAYSDGDAYTIFETMNDRGLSLTPADMLKGYLLANITDTAERNNANSVWKQRVAVLMELGKDEEADGIKSWLRSQYAHSIRERKRNATPKDFDLIGTEFHRWVRDNQEDIGLLKSKDFLEFISRDFVFYSKWYEKLRAAGNALTEGLESIFYNAEHNFTLQYPVLLAPVLISDPEEIIMRKIKVTALYLDILINRRIWNYRVVDYSSMQYAMFVVMKDIRGKSIDELTQILTNKLIEEPGFSTDGAFKLNKMNGRVLHHILARITEYVEVQSGMASRYTEYAKRGGKDAYEIEHIWANHVEIHTDEFAHQNDFAEYRDRVGDLLLLPKSFNASFGDMKYAKKAQKYVSQNLLAASLNTATYERNPGFLRFIEKTGLPFRAHEEFKKADLDARQSLYIQLAELVWSPAKMQMDNIEVGLHGPGDK